MVNRPPLQVLITIDTAVWCDGWDALDKNFPAAFQKYIYGPTRKGNYGLPFQLQMFQDHGLKAVYYVEPLFALRFGLEPLQEIVGLIQEHDQAVELQLHPAWVDEAREPVFPDQNGKRQHMKMFSCEEQQTLIAMGRDMLLEAGADGVCAFRAGNFGANRDTLRALAGAGISYDSSYNPACSDCDIDSPEILQQPAQMEGVTQVPMTTFIDGTGRRRQASVTACGVHEMTQVFEAALAGGWEHFVLRSQSFDLLSADKSRPNRVVTRRFLRLCEYLADSTALETTEFANSAIHVADNDVPTLRCGMLATAGRFAQQTMAKIR